MHCTFPALPFDKPQLSLHLLPNTNFANREIDEALNIMKNKWPNTVNTTATRLLLGKGNREKSQWQNIGNVSKTTDT